MYADLPYIFTYRDTRIEIEEEFQNKELSIKKLKCHTKTLFDNFLLPRLKPNLCISFNRPILQQRANDSANGFDQHNDLSLD